MTLASIPHAKQRVKISDLKSKIVNQQPNPYFFFCTKTRLKYSSSTVKSSAVEIHKLFSTALELTKNLFYIKTQQSNLFFLNKKPI